MTLMDEGMRFEFGIMMKAFAFLFLFIITWILLSKEPLTLENILKFPLG